MSQLFCGADTPVREMRIASGDAVSGNGILAAILGSFTVFRAVMHEIFDEAAYQRFLERSQLESSVSAYKAFRKENDQAKSRKPRCC
jgi:hypothetical protein